MNISTIKILLIDDSKTVLEDIKQMLFDAGASMVETESNPEKALELIIEKDGNNPYDLIFCDQIMPEMHGTDVIKQIEMKKLKNRPHFVILTGEVNRQMAMLIATSKGDGYLIKPPTPESLKDKIKEVLED
jgi:two-component system chemotaxis response regulator CheY